MRFFGQVARFSDRWAPWVIAAWAAAAVGLFLVAPSLQEVGVQDQASFLPASAPSQQADALLARLYPDDATRNGAILTFTRDGGLTDADHAHIADVVRRLQEPRLAAQLTSVQSAATAPELAALLRSPDGAAELVLAGFKAVPFTEDGSRSVADLRAAIGGQPAGLEQHVSGIAGLASDQKDALVSSFDRTAIVTVLLVLTILVIVYRSVVAPLIPLASIAVSFIVAQGLIGILAEHGFKVASLAGTFMVVMVFGAGTDYCLFLVSRFREDVAVPTTGTDDGLRPIVRRTTTVIGAVIAASAATVIVGFLSLATAQFGLYRTMGPAMGIAIFITMLAGLTLTPALLRVAGRFTFWPTKIATIRTHGVARHTRWERVAAAVVAHPGQLLLAGIIALQIPAAGLGWYKQSFDLVKGLPPGADARQGFDALARHLPGGTLSPTYVIIDVGHPLDDAQLGEVDRLNGVLRSTPGVGQVRSITQPVGAPLTLKTINELGGDTSDPSRARHRPQHHRHRAPPQRPRLARGTPFHRTHPAGLPGARRPPGVLHRTRRDSYPPRRHRGREPV